MADRKTVIDGLRICTGDTPKSCRGCPFYKYSSECITDLEQAALELIEGDQQEAEEES